MDVDKVPKKEESPEFVFNTEIKEEMEEMEVYEESPSTSFMEKLPAYMRKRRRVEEEEVYQAIVVPSLGAQKPALLYKFISIDENTGEETEKCYAFCYNKGTRNHHIYRCSFCKTRHKKTVTVKVVGETFLSDPTAIGHMCAGADWADEWAKRTIYKTSQTLRSSEFKSNPKRIFMDVLQSIQTDEDTGDQEKYALSSALGTYERHRSTISRAINSQRKKAAMDARHGAPETLKNDSSPSPHSITYANQPTFSNFVNSNLAEVKVEEPSDEVTTSVVTAPSEMSGAQDTMGSRLTLQTLEEPFRTPRESRSPSVGANRLLLRLEEENESLSEQVEILDKMNERLTRRVKDLESKAASGKKENESQEALKIKQLEEMHEKSKKEDDLKNKKITDLLMRVEAAESALQLKSADFSEAQKKLEEKAEELEKARQKMEIMENEIRSVIQDVPKAENMTILKNYLHPEMARRAEEVVRDAVGTRGLRGDDATRFVSNSFDQLYGQHWQCVMFRSDGHGCFVYHNNNCYISFQLGKYQMVLFRY